MRYQIYDQNGMNFITCTVVEWIDLFTRTEIADIIIDSLRYCQEHKGLNIYAYVLMPSHLHLICGTADTKGLSSILQAFKSFTAKAIIKYLKDPSKPESRREWLLNHFAFNARKQNKGSEYQVWQRDNHPIYLHTTRVIRQKLIYIHNNPVVDKLVSKPHHYLRSSASNYQNGIGILNITVIDEIWNDVGLIA